MHRMSGARRRLPGNPALAQALWSLARGMVALELDGRFPRLVDEPILWEESSTSLDLSPELGASIVDPGTFALADPGLVALARAAGESLVSTHA